MRKGSVASGSESALSEVIGFVLILAIITAAFSLYLVYGVPVQGRENEITHMNDIKDQFVSYKLGVDSLWTNGQTGIALSTSFPLGTASQTTQGTSGILPVLQPIGSSGTLAINQRTATPERFTISSRTYIRNSTVLMSDLVALASASPLNVTYSNPVSHLLLNVSVSGVNPSENPVRGITILGDGWTAIINITPQMTYYESYNLSSIDDSYTLTKTDAYHYNRSDLTISVLKNGIRSLDGSIVYSNIGEGTYTIDLLDPAYGINSIITYPTTVEYYIPFSDISADALAQYSYLSQSGYSYSVPLGSLEYTGNNNYWISQSYYYQMGGVFLSQIDGITYKIPPTITFSNNGDGNYTVNIVALAYMQNSGGIVGGTSPAQVSTQLVDSGNLPYADIRPNTWSVSINITTPDPNAQIMWKKYLDEAANQTGGIPNSSYSVGLVPNGSFISFPASSTGNPYITLKVKTANISANLQAVGGA
jgi:hypothetical protein